MSQEHSPAAVPFQSESIQRIAFRVLGLQKSQIRLPFIADHLAARETPYGDDHPEAPANFLGYNRFEHVTLLFVTFCVNIRTLSAQEGVFGRSCVFSLGFREEISKKNVLVKCVVFDSSTARLVVVAGSVVRRCQFEN